MSNLFGFINLGFLNNYSNLKHNKIHNSEIFSKTKKKNISFAFSFFTLVTITVTVFLKFKKQIKKKKIKNLQKIADLEKAIENSINSSIFFKKKNEILKKLIEKYSYFTETYINEFERIHLYTLYITESFLETIINFQKYIRIKQLDSKSLDLVEECEKSMEIMEEYFTFDIFPLINTEMTYAQKSKTLFQKFWSELIKFLVKK